LINTFARDGTIIVAGDDTTIEHRGTHVYGAGCHRDAARSTHRYRVFMFGHKWVVLFLLVRLPMTSRTWALPVMASLYRSKKWDQAHGERHRNLQEIMRCLISKLLHWFPDRRFVFVGDAAYMTHRLTAMARRSKGRLTVVGQFYGSAGLFLPPPLTQGRGRPRIKGDRLPSPSTVVKTSKAKRLSVAWYGGRRHLVEIVTGTGLWYRAGEHAHPAMVRWVFVHDPSGGYKDIYLATTDLRMSPKWVIETYVKRWAVETTFQEAKAHLGLGTARNRSRPAVLRQTACLFGIYSLVALAYAQLPKAKQRLLLLWPGKKMLTFSDALAAVRRQLWHEWFFLGGAGGHSVEKIPRIAEDALLDALIKAA
jgi:hypothetical protein